MPQARFHEQMWTYTRQGTTGKKLRTDVLFNTSDQDEVMITIYILYVMIIIHDDYYTVKKEIYKALLFI